MGLDGYDLSAPGWSDRYLTSVYSTIEACWRNSVRGTEYRHLLKQALAPDRLLLDQPERSPRKWAPVLPLACCQAAGGKPETAIPIAAAWLLFYLAAHTLDAVADGDEPDPWWRELGPGPAINVATGLLVSGPLALNLLHQDPATKDKAPLVLGEFCEHVLTIAAGQHHELIAAQMDLSQWWAIADTKAGAPFSLACRAGSMLAPTNAETIEQLSRFGYELGLLVQMMDDVLELQAWARVENAVQRGAVDRLLPCVYALEVLSGSGRERLRNLMAQGVPDPAAAQETFREVSRSGAAVYLTTEIQKHRRRANHALQMAQLTGPAQAWLQTLIHEDNIPDSLIA